jgi:SAM-dependent methyltransferase
MKFLNYLNEIDARIKTARSSGAVGQNAIVPRIIKLLGISKDQPILDFGCGSAQIHVNNLKKDGYNVVGTDLSLPGSYPSGKKFSVIYASNVLNVQSSIEQLNSMLNEIKTLLVNNGIFISNYPSSPRYMKLNNSEMETILKNHFNSVERIPNSIAKSNIAWKCK